MSRMDRNIRNGIIVMGIGICLIGVMFLMMLFNVGYDFLTQWMH